ncbi:MAG: DUF3859 domain-containing protein [Ignavibacteriaceae bacterium]
MKKNSGWGKISFGLTIIGALLMALYFTNQDLSKYIYHPALKFPDFMDSILTGGIIFSFLGGFIFSIIALLRKDTGKIFPIITLSITGFILFLAIITQIESWFMDYDVKYGVITNYGVFEIPTTRIENGTEKILYNQRILKNNTNEINAKLGTRFGFNYVIAGEPDGEGVSLKKIIKYPEPGLIFNSKTTAADTFNIYVKLNEINYSGFIFEHNEELIPGIWTIEYFYEGRRILQKEFDVKKESL